MYLRKKFICTDLGIRPDALNEWIKRGIFPQGVVLNPGSGREIIGFPEEVYEAWKASRPQRQATAPTLANAARRASAAARKAARQAVITNGNNAPTTDADGSETVMQPMRPFLTRPK
jgi:hypothetical protein